MVDVILLALATFASAATGDFVEAYYVRAMQELNAHRAARMSIGMWAVGLVGWLVVVKVSLWYLVPEVAGLYVGSLYAVQRLRTDCAG